MGMGFIALLLPVCASTAGANGLPEPLKAALVSGGKVNSVEINTAEALFDGQTIALADGRVLRLASISTPLRPLGVPDIEPWPAVDAARQGLASILKSSDPGISLYYDKERSDRHGNIVAHAETSSGIWLQQALLQAGWARVRTTPQNFAGAENLYAAEGAARDVRRGLWADAYYRVRCAADHRDIADGFQVVAGRVVDVASVRNIIYLNFGASWRADFTIKITGGARRKLGFEQAPEHLIGEVIEVRGVVFRENGPMIDLDHRAALRLPGELVQDIDVANKKGCPVGDRTP